MIPDQFECVVDSLEQAGGLDLQLANLPHCVAVGLPQPGPQSPAAIWADQTISRLEPVVQAVVDMAEFQQLNIRKFDNLKRISTVCIHDKSGRPVEHDKVRGGVGQREL